MAKKNTFNVDEERTQEFSKEDYKRVLKYLKPYQKQFIFVLISIFFANFLAMLGPYFTKLAIDELIPKQEIKKLIFISVIFIISLLLIRLFTKYRIWEITKLGQLVLKDIRFDIFSHLQKLSFQYFDSRPHGKILIRVVNYINTLSDLLSNGLINLISDILNVIITLTVMFFIDVKLTLYSMVLLPVLFGITILIKNLQRKAYQDLSNKQSNLNAYIHESISGIKITQSFTREEKNEEIFDQLAKENHSSWMKASLINRLLWPAVENISILTTCLLYFIGIRQIGVEVSTGTLVAFMGYINNFWNPIINIGNFYNSLVTATAYLERIFETLAEEPDIKDNPQAVPLLNMQGHVSFDHVSFRYEEAGKKILDDVSFDVPSGRRVALVGPTGAGKTTIINLLSRFYDVNEGSVKVDGQDVRDVTLSSLRSQMGVMLQDTFIFSGTILENIRYGKLDATEEEVIVAAKIVRAHDFIKDLPNGYQTAVEERGSTLSAGQRQLLSFARVLLADPRILILDEATSSIDTETEELLQKGLDELLKNRTSFIIAHRLSTIKNSDEIIYFDQGKIIEKGSHDELMALKGRYHYLYQSQFDAIKADDE